MEVNNHKIEDYDLVLDALYGEENSPERKGFEEEAKAYFMTQHQKQ